MSVILAMIGYSAIAIALAVVGASRWFDGKKGGKAIVGIAMLWSLLPVISFVISEHRRQMAVEHLERGA